MFAGQLAPERLEEIEDRAIEAALSQQQGTGIGVYTDDEFRRIVYMTSLAQAVDGFVMGQGDRLPWKATGREVPQEMWEFTLPVVTERLRLKFRVSETESAFLRGHAPGQFKLTIPSPVHFVQGGWKPGLSDAAYATPYDLMWDIARILSDEAGQLAAEGVPYIQLDAPTYTQFLDSDGTSGLRSTAWRRKRLLDEALDAGNSILDAAHAGGAVTGVHLCRGNGMGA
jgi:methionine synthase II (cobalamin-independent)